MILFAWAHPDDLKKARAAFKKPHEKGSGYAPVMLYASPADAPGDRADDLVKVHIRVDAKPKI